jgi:hypothetical protein
MKGTASFLAILWTLLLPIVALEAMPNGGDRHPTGSNGEDVTTTIDVNNIEMFVTNIGAFAYDVWASRGQYDGLYYPKGTDKTAVYASGLWLGAKVRDTIRVAIAEYSQEYGPGKMIDHTWDDPDDPPIQGLQN